MCPAASVKSMVTLWLSSSPPVSAASAVPVVAAVAVKLQKLLRVVNPEP